jgi:hypothetical protein
MKHEAYAEVSLRTGQQQRGPMKFRKGKSGNPGGRPKVLGELQELARHHAPAVIAELARLALKAKSETARIAAGRELLDRGFGRARQSLEVSHPEENIIQMLLDDIDARNRESERLNATKWKQSGSGAPSSS